MACPVCSAPDREAIDASLRDQGIRPTLRSYPEFKLGQLHRHRVQHLGLEGLPGAEQPEPGDVETQPHPAHTAAVDRVRHVVGLILRREWTPEVSQRLQRRWEVGPRAIRSYVAAAGASLALDRGSLEAQRAVAIADVSAIRDKAMDAEDFRAAMAAQVHLDRLRGLLVSTGPLVQVNVERQRAETDALDGLLERIVEVLRPWPDALAAVSLVFEVAEAERRRTLGIVDTTGEAVA